MNECSNRTHDRAKATGGTMLLLAALVLPSSGCQPDDLTFQTDDIGFAGEEAAVVESRPEIGIPPPPEQLAASRARLIRSGSARVEVADLEFAVSEARRMGEAVGGYVAGSEFREGSEGARSAALVLRVPADSVDVLIETLPELGKVLSVSISAQDVSRDYMDVATRLTVQEETVDRLRALAARGGELDGLLAAERELGRAVSELESLKGRIRYFDERIAESDIHLSLLEPGAALGAGAFRPLRVAFSRSVEIFANSLAYIIYAVVFALPWIVLALLLLPFVGRWRAARRAGGAAE